MIAISKHLLGSKLYSKVSSQILESSLDVLIWSMLMIPSGSITNANHYFQEHGSIKQSHSIND